MSTVRNLPAIGVRSLCWHGEDLVDWVGGARVFHEDGSSASARVSWGGFPFDAVVASDDGAWVVMFQRLGTKGLVLRGGQPVREIDRSFYHSTAYEYPVAVFKAPSGQLLLAHCPEDYNRLEFEDLEGGTRLTASTARKPADFFHSRLSTNPSGTRLLSAGWVWHPWDAVVFFDVGKCLGDPRHLDRLNGTFDSRNVGLAEESSACWLDDDRIVLGGSDEPEDPEEMAEAGDRLRLRRRGLAVHNIREERFESSVVLDNPAGTMMAVGPDRVVTFYDHPRLLEVSTGALIEEWPELHTGHQASSIIWGLKEPIPPLALDPRRKRFAVAGAAAITVVRL